MSRNNFRREDDMTRLFVNKDVTALFFIQNHSSEMYGDFKNFCQENGFDEEETSAELFLEQRQEVFNDAFAKGNV